MRYEPITDPEHIYAGADGKVQTSEDIGNFLEGWATWLSDIINIIAEFTSNNNLPLLPI